VSYLTCGVEPGPRDRDLDRPLCLLDVHLARRLRERAGTLRVPRLADLDDTRASLGDVTTSDVDAAGMERAHRELRAGLADRLGGDDPHRVADLGHTARTEEEAVAQPASPPLAAALQH